MSTFTTPPRRRFALGLPAGSIRALLGLTVLGLMWVLALHDPKPLGELFLYLQSVMILILVHYFAAHGKSHGRGVGEGSALGLPRGSVRFLLLAGNVGLLAWLVQTDRAIAVTRLEPFFLLLALLLGGFFIGYLLNALVTGGNDRDPPAWYQDVQGWVALLAGIALAVVVIVSSVINPSLAKEAPVNVELVEACLSALIGFYFGARS